MSYAIALLSFALFVFLIISFLSVKVSLLVTVIDSYCKTIYPIVSLFIQITWIIILHIHLLEKALVSLILDQVNIQNAKSLVFSTLP